MATSAEVVFMLDVDNTLLDNDRFAADLTARLDQLMGVSERERYWRIYGNRRSTLGYADYLGALEEFRLNSGDEAGLLQLSDFLLDYPFADLLYPGSMAVIAHLRGMGTTIVLSDGDIVFQPRKIRRCGVWDAVEGRVLVYLHKERMIEATERYFPGGRYVMVDDKAALLAVMKGQLDGRLTTVFARQGHYAFAPEVAGVSPQPDLTIEHIGELLSFSLADFRAPRQRP